MRIWYFLRSHVHSFTDVPYHNSKNSPVCGLCCGISFTCEMRLCTVNIPQSLTNTNYTRLYSTVLNKVYEHLLPVECFFVFTEIFLARFPAIDRCTVPYRSIAKIWYNCTFIRTTKTDKGNKQIGNNGYRTSTVPYRYRSVYYLNLGSVTIRYCTVRYSMTS